MRKRMLILTFLLATLVAGCGKGAASPTPTTLPPSPTPVPETVATEPPASTTPSGSATCVAAPLDLQAEPRIPPVTEDDHVHGPAGAPITFIEYADFQ
jgi:hypothetical protein